MNYLQQNTDICGIGSENIDVNIFLKNLGVTIVVIHYINGPP